MLESQHLRDLAKTARNLALATPFADRREALIQLAIQYDSKAAAREAEEATPPPIL